MAAIVKVARKYGTRMTELRKIFGRLYFVLYCFRRDTCTMFRKKKRDYMKAKVNKLEENRKNKNNRERGLRNSRRAINLALM